jgi:DNA-directed RNA polymerase subunit RPC12/RpoP
VSDCRQYVCACCGEPFVSAVPESEALSEFRALFGRTMDPAKDAVICDDCFHRLGVPERVLG